MTTEEKPELCGCGKDKGHAGWLLCAELYGMFYTSGKYRPAIPVDTKAAN